MAFQLCRQQLQQTPQGRNDIILLPFVAADSEEGHLHEKYRELQAKAMKVRENALRQNLFQGIFFCEYTEDSLINLGLWTTACAIYQHLRQCREYEPDVKKKLEIYKSLLALLVQDFSDDIKRNLEPLLQEKGGLKQCLSTNFDKIPFDINMCATPKVQTLVNYLLEEAANNPNFQAIVLMTHPRQIDALAWALDYCVPGKAPLRAEIMLGKSKSSKKIPLRLSPWIWKRQLANVLITMHTKGTMLDMPPGAVVVAFDDFKTCSDMISVSRGTRMVGGCLTIMNSLPQPRYLAWMGFAGWTGTVTGPRKEAWLAADMEKRAKFELPIPALQHAVAPHGFSFVLTTQNKAYLTDDNAKPCLTAYLQAFDNHHTDWEPYLLFDKKMKKMWSFEVVNSDHLEGDPIQPLDATALIPVRKEICWPLWSQSRKALLGEIDIALLDKYTALEESTFSYSVLKVKCEAAYEKICKQKTSKMACLWLYLAGELDENLVPTIKDSTGWCPEYRAQRSYKRARLF